ncbi:MAG: polysaccharide biosynthesis protein [Clostridia bacterium]|nr:polysaccharide biosynthesis protein [Clostridia bacterium]
MKIERTKNAGRNLKWGLVNKIVGLVLPFVCRAAIIRIFGINYLGLNNLFTSILSTLSLAELGFGSAVVFFMYRAVAENDVEKTCALMNYYKKVYRVVGVVILVIGLALIPFLHTFIKKDVPTDINIYVVYILTLLGTVVSYFLFAYKNCILDAYQRKDIILNVNTVVLFVEKILQLVFIFITKNYYMYLVAIVLTNIANNVITAIIVKKRYPQYCAKGTLEKTEKKEIGKKIQGLFLYKIGNVVFGSADNIVMSAFLGLAVTGVYGNYYYIITTLFAFLGIYYNAIRAGIGNSLIMESKEKNYHDFKQLQFIQSWVVGWCTVCLLCLFQDFIVLYAGEENVFDISVVISLCLYFYVWKIIDVVNVYKEAGGMWDRDKFRPLVSGAVNLTLNIFFVQIIGIYGIIFSTILSQVIIDLPWAPKALISYFDIKGKEFYKCLLKGYLDLILMAVPTYLICIFINFNPLVNLLIKAPLCLIVPNAIFMLINHKSVVFKSAIFKIRGMFKLN